MVKLFHSSTVPMENKFLLAPSLDPYCSTYILCLLPSHHAHLWQGWLCVFITSLLIAWDFSPSWSHLVSRLNKHQSLSLSPQDKCSSPDHFAGLCWTCSYSLMSYTGAQKLAAVIKMLCNEFSSLANSFVINELHLLASFTVLAFIIIWLLFNWITGDMCYIHMCKLSSP